MHRDIKSGNILLTSAGDVKLGDFGELKARRPAWRLIGIGVSKLVSATISKRPEMAGSPLWMSPEVIKGRPVSFNTDVWSLGITAIELAEGKPPRSEMSSYQIMKAIAKDGPPTFFQPTKWSAPFRDFVAQCLVCDPEARPDSIKILSHPFLTSIGAAEDKFQQRLRQALNGRHRTSSFGAKLKDITDKAQRAISRSTSPRVDEQSNSSSVRDDDDDDNDVFTDDNSSAFTTAVIRSEFDDDEQEKPIAKSGPEPTSVFDSEPLRADSGGVANKNNVVVIVMAIVIVAVAIAVKLAR